MTARICCQGIIIMMIYPCVVLCWLWFSNAFHHLPFKSGHLWSHFCCCCVLVRVHRQWTFILKTLEWISPFCFIFMCFFFFRVSSIPEPFIIIFFSRSTYRSLVDREQILNTFPILSNKVDKRKRTFLDDYYYGIFLFLYMFLSLHLVSKYKWLMWQFSGIRRIIWTFGMRFTSTNPSWRISDLPVGRNSIPNDKEMESYSIVVITSGSRFGSEPNQRDPCPEYCHLLVSSWLLTARGRRCHHLLCPWKMASTL